MSAKTKQAAITDAPLLGPQSHAEWAKQTLAAMCQNTVSNEARAEYRQLLELRPQVAVLHGLPAMVQGAMLEPYQREPIIAESIAFQINKMRAQLAGANASPTELLLIEAIVGCYTDYWTFTVLKEQRTRDKFTLDAMEQWERILASKETRYLRAIETLARVRRLLKLTVQINVAQSGSQQVNVAGDVQV